MCIELSADDLAAKSRLAPEVAPPPLAEPAPGDTHLTWSRRGRKGRRRGVEELEPRPKRKRRRKQRRRAPRAAAAKQGSRPEEGAPEAPLLPVFAKNVRGLVDAFEAGTLAREDFTHAAHLVVALAYAHGHRLEAYSLLREGIQRYNAATGLVETPTRGYHETITQAWFHLVLHFLDVYDTGQSLQALADDLIQLFGRDDLFRHYSRARLLAPGARAGWVEPDLAPLPELEALTPADRRWAAEVAASRQAAPLSRRRVAERSETPALSRV